MARRNSSRRVSSMTANNTVDDIEEIFKRNQRLSNVLAKEKEGLDAKSKDKSFKKDLENAKLLSDYKDLLNKKEQDKYYDRERELIAEAKKALSEAHINAVKESGKLQEQFATATKEKLKDTFSYENVSKGLTSLMSDLDKRMDDYLNKQQAIAAHLTGSNDSLDNITDKMSILSSTSLVEQKAVYNNLYKLITSGIVANAEQKAFLQTLTDDIDLVFNATDGTLVRLINLQQTDLTSNRVAIQYSLQTFLNQNYETSTYIKDSFTQVSNSLIEMQSLMSSGEAMASEATIQKWLGSFSSAGAASSTITSLANALNAFGSGNISSLGSGISNLILMGASEAGQDIASILNNGLSSNSIDAIMSGVISYLQDMSGYESNVVKSQLASVFGVNITDLLAAQNMQGRGSVGGVTTDINSALLNQYGDFVPFANRFSNIFENFMNTWAMNTANNPALYGIFKGANFLAPILGSMLEGYSASVNFLGLGSVTTNLGRTAQTALQVTSGIIPLIATIGKLATNIGNIFTSDAGGLYSSLANNNNTIYKSAGSGFVTTGTNTVSESYAMSSSGSSSDMFSTIKNSAAGLGADSIFSEQSDHSVEDVYQILNSGRVSLMGNYFDTTTDHAEAIASTSQTIDENVSLITNITKDILDLLNDRLTSIDDNIALMSRTPTNNDTTSGWLTTLI